MNELDNGAANCRPAQESIMFHPGGTSMVTANPVLGALSGDETIAHESRVVASNRF
jgi:hypothetical protein